MDKIRKVSFSFENEIIENFSRISMTNGGIIDEIIAYINKKTTIAINGSENGSRKYNSINGNLTTRLIKFKYLFGKYKLIIANKAIKLK